ncbi:MAG: hypothetical protein R6U88_03540 [Candidatus Bipolaricaulota bacterium]
MSVVEMLTLLTEVVNSVQRAVEHLESGNRPSGMAGLDACIDRIDSTLQRWSESEVAEAGSAVDPTDMRGQLEAVLEDLRAAREILTAASPGQQER